MAMTRRHFLVQSAAMGAGLAGLHRWARGGSFIPTPEAGYGPLVKDYYGLLDLPRGFSYRVISRLGDRMDDGLLVPGLPDGMAAFPVAGAHNGLMVLVRNHEIAEKPAALSPFGRDNALLDLVPASKRYDSGRGVSPCLGGTSNIVFDTRTGRKHAEFLSLACTSRNCAGGPTPWGSWLTCEETVQRAEGNFEKDHGYVFEVPASPRPMLADPTPIKEMGRFNHEAVCIDPRTGIVYLTEDRDDGLLYRFIPNVPGELHKGGRLQALCVRGRRSLDARNWGQGPTIAAGEVLEADWMDLENIDAPQDDLRKRGFEAGAARFARGEGMYWGTDGAYFVCTTGGEARKGQVWVYYPSEAEGTAEESSRPGRLVLFIEPNDPAQVDMPDNLTVAPWGDLILAEDGDGENAIVGCTPEGRLYRLARNAFNDTEFAGVTFSPDGTTLFVNMQGLGLTVAITGPWRG